MHVICVQRMLIFIETLLDFYKAVYCMADFLSHIFCQLFFPGLSG